MVRIEQHVWGMTPEGEAIILYTLRNDRGAEVRLSNYGAAIVAAVMPDREGRMADVVLGYKHPEGYFHDGAAAGKSGVVIQRIAFGRMTVEGEEYALEVNNGQKLPARRHRTIPPTAFGRAAWKPTAWSSVAPLRGRRPVGDLASCGVEAFRDF